MLLWLINLNFAGGDPVISPPLGGIARHVVDTLRRRTANVPTVIDKDYPQADPVT